MYWRLLDYSALSMFICSQWHHWVLFLSICIRIGALINIKKHNHSDMNTDISCNFRRREQLKLPLSIKETLHFYYKIRSLKKVVIDYCKLQWSWNHFEIYIIQLCRIYLMYPLSNRKYTWFIDCKRCTKCPLYRIRTPSMMTSSNGNNFCVTGLLCGEFTGHRWIPHTKASDAEVWCFLWSACE